jgi:plasmid stabilization system protein ParE
MSKKIRINPIALADLREIMEPISHDSPETALRIVREIVSRYESLAEFPEMGVSLANKLRSNFPQIKLKSNYRYLVCGQYLVFYVYEGETVSINRILHTKRNSMALLGGDS